MKKKIINLIMTFSLVAGLSFVEACGVNYDGMSTNVEKTQDGTEAVALQAKEDSVDDKIVSEEAEGIEQENEPSSDIEEESDNSLCEFTTEPLENNGYILEPVHVSIPGCTKKYNILFLSDMHIVNVNDEIAADEREFVSGRKEEFTSSFKTPWEELSVLLDECNADMILLGGDMLDFCSQANAEELGTGLEQISTPYLYVRADHDIRPFWLADQDKEKSKALQDMICENEDAMLMEFDDFIILGINNNTYQFTEEGLAKAKEAFSKNKPIILLAHVPFCSEVDDTLAKASRDRWPNHERELIWGTGYAYEPDETTQKLMDLIYAEDSPVVQIFCGHLHCMWDGMITERTSEHVFSPAYAGYIGVITVDGMP